MVQRTVGRGVGVLVAALLAAGAAQAQGAGGATVVLRDGKRIEAAQVEFSDRTFVVRTLDGEEHRLDERDVLRVELVAPDGQAAPRQEFLARHARVIDDVPLGLRLAWQGFTDPATTTYVASRRQLPDGDWIDVEGATLSYGSTGPSDWKLLDQAAAWPHRYEYRVRTYRVVNERLGELLGEVVLPPAAARTRQVWVVPAGRSGDQVLVHVRRPGDEKPRAHQAVRPGEPILIDGRPTGAKVVSVGVEADGVPAIRVAWEGIPEPELVRADHAFGVPAADRRSVMTKVAGAPPAPVDAARRVAVDLDDVTQLEFARTVARLTGLDLALVVQDNASVDLHLRAVEGEQLVSLGAELLGRRLASWCGVRCLSSKDMTLSERRAAPDGPLSARLDGERLALWIAADARAFDLEDALALFRATTGIDVVVSTRAREHLKGTTAPESLFVHARGATLAQTLSMLTGARGLTWTTRQDVVMVKRPTELQIDEVWLDVDVPEGTPLESLAETMREAGVRFYVRDEIRGAFWLPATRGRVRLDALLEGSRYQWRADQLEVEGPRPLPGVCDVHGRADGYFDVRNSERGGSSQLSLEQVASSAARQRVRVWVRDPAATVAALRAKGAEIVTINGRPPAPAAAPGPGAYYDGSGNLPPTEQVPGFPWLRRAAGVTYAQPRKVPDVFYQRYQSLEEVSTLLEESEGEFTTNATGQPVYHLIRIDEHSDLRTRVGLQEGDKVISVNGQPIGANAAAARELHERLKGERRFALLVERQGQHVVLSFYVE